MAPPDDDAAAPPSTTGESSSGIQNQRPGAGLVSSVPRAHAGASDADFSAGTGATWTARARVCRVSFRVCMLNAGGYNCCCCQQVQPAGPCVPVSGRTALPELTTGRVKPLGARTPHEPRSLARHDQFRLLSPHAEGICFCCGQLSRSSSSLLQNAA